MYLKSLSLVNFRNYVRLELELPPHITVLCGDNAQGKTNLLEAVYYLATANSPRADADRQLLNWLAETDVMPYARLVGQAARGGSITQIEITLLKNGANGATGEGALRKGIRVNGVNRRVTELIGRLYVVLFLPQDLHLVDGSPDARRRYLDSLLCQVDARYYRALQKYGQVLYQRNHLLRRLRERPDPEQLTFWNRQLIAEGAYLITRRRWLVGRLNEQAQHIHPALTGNLERLKLQYQPSVRLGEAEATGMQLALAFEAERASEEELEEIRRAFEAQLAPLGREEIERGSSLLGPHRDEMRFLVNDIDMTTFGSRGQQRTAALATKLAEVEWLYRQTGEMPILLLDDVISELDLARRGFLLNSLKEGQQVVITTTTLDGYPAEFLQRATVWRVEQGRIQPL